MTTASHKQNLYMENVRHENLTRVRKAFEMWTDGPGIERIKEKQEEKRKC